MPPRPDADYVSDQVGYVDEKTRAELRRLNGGFEEVGIQIVVAVIPSLDGQDIESYANQVFRAWGIGDADEDNGLLLLISEQDKKIPHRSRARPRRCYHRWNRGIYLEA